MRATRVERERARGARSTSLPAARVARDARRVDARRAATSTAHHREQERRVAAGADRDVLVGLARRLGAARVDDDELAAALADARAGAPRMSGAVRTLPFETTGFAPTQRK